MNSGAAEQATTLPEVADDDIIEVEHYLCISFDGPRRDVLRSNESFDVQACPGSGKTTLLVAKLAILAKKWAYTRRGICVLSHTNAARHEVESRLADTAAGQRLLAYPHFVGTIHGFVNEFLALPLLRSEGQPVRLIDDEACGDYCRRLLHSDWTYSKARQFLGKKEASNPDRTIRGLRYEGDTLTLGSAEGTIPCGPQSDSYRQLHDIKRRAAAAGLWRHDDMFAWAGKLLVQHSHATEFVRWRFPAVFIDEMQDTSEIQNAVLARLFPLVACALRQRFGDCNQAIYDFGQSRATTDAFPNPNGKILSLLNSKRFGFHVAKKAGPLAPVAPDPELTGEGPQPDILPAIVDPAAMPHTVFFFGPTAAQEVIPAFGKLLLATFPAAVFRPARFVAKAVGHRGKKSDGARQKLPQSLGDYWEGYEPGAAKPEPRPQTLGGFLRLAQRKRDRTGDCSEAVQTAARGLIELIDRIIPIPTISRARSMSLLRELISPDDSTLRFLQRMLWQWCVDAVPLVETGWPEHLAALRDALRPVIGERWTPDAEDFCTWSAEFDGEALNDMSSALAMLNRYRFSDRGRVVNIGVGTIHSAKGQTHTATLVLETFVNTHDLTDLLPWLMGNKRGAKPREGPERLERMRLIYTAMTRPTHLLCLAMREEALGEGENRRANIVGLESAGWKVTHL